MADTAMPASSALAVSNWEGARPEKTRKSPLSSSLTGKVKKRRAKSNLKPETGERKPR